MNRNGDGDGAAENDPKLRCLAGEVLNNARIIDKHRWGWMIEFSA